MIVWGGCAGVCGVSYLGPNPKSDGDGGPVGGWMGFSRSLEIRGGLI
jgi:hypothetical protein